MVTIEPQLQECCSDSCVKQLTNDYFRSRVVGDVALLHRQLDAGQLSADLRQLQRQAPFRSTLYLLLSWGGFWLAWWLLVNLPSWAGVLALVLAGISIRAIGVLLHDFSHRNGFRRQSLNEWVGQWLLAVPLAGSMARYRTQHMQHHANLGDPVRDPDYVNLPAVEAGAFRGLRSYASAVFRRSNFANSLLDGWWPLSAPGVWRAHLWWLGLTLAAVGLAGPHDGLAVPLLWFTARASSYHLIKVFTELSDHAGLPPGGVLHYTRNMPGNWVRHLINPYGDNYHLVHHLAPTVPLARLAQAHRLFLQSPAYARISNPQSYFLGSDSILKSWSRLAPYPHSCPVSKIEIPET